MVNAKETIKKLHKEIPDLSLDDILKILDCIVEEKSNDGSYDFITPNPFEHEPWYKDAWKNQIKYCKNHIDKYDDIKIN